MIDVCLLGTGGMMPLPYRALTSLMVRYNGMNVLIDCGEGTQVSIKQQGWSVKPIDVICFTHFHADHISGLPGLLLTLGNAERTEPITMIGPKRLEKIVNSLRMIAPDLPFEIRFIELEREEESFVFNGLRINAFKVNHNITCYGYSLELDRAGKFDVERARAQQIPMLYWNRLQKGESIEEGDRLYTPDMVLGEVRRGIKITYCTDSRPTKGIIENARSSDLFVCEGMYGEPDKEQKAKEYKHMTFYEAAAMAKEAEVKELWLTHYSPSLVRPQDYQDRVRAIFPQTVIAKDRRTTTLLFDKE
ncbi:MAG: ribonuclease Z [Lachnospiraceae bacterium]|nr:ribonuclease Z [Lachnospiraceae bacterium]MDE6624827.1 ribonuclease Z [Lachnospiraceae bacterium]